MAQSRRQWLIGILIVSALLRFAAVPVAHNLGFTPDEREYRFLADRLQHEDRFIDSNGDLSVRSPLFPFLLSLVPGATSDYPYIPLVLETVLGVFSVFLVYRLALAIWENEAAALVASGAAALHPGLIVYSTLLLTETPFVVLFLSLLLLARRFLRAPTPGSAVLIGILAGFATLMRGVFLFPFCLLMLVLWVSFPEIGWSALRRATFVSIPLLVCIGVLAPWTIRNYEVHHSLVPVSTFTGVSLVYGNNPYMHGSTKFDAGFEEWFREQRRIRGITDSASASEYERMKVDQDVALDYIRTHPMDTVKHMVQKAYVLWIYPLSHQQPNKPLKLIMMVADVVLYLGAALGIVMARSSRKPLALFWVLIFAFTVLHMVLHAEARYRVPLVPLVCVLFGGVGIALQDRAALMNDRTMIRQTVAVSLAILGIYALTVGLYVTGNV